MQPAEKIQEPARGPVSLAELTARWARAKVQEEIAGTEAERLRAEILAAGAEIGHADDHLEIRSRAVIKGCSMSASIDNRKLEQVLREQACLKDAYEDKRLSLSKVRAIAKLNKAVARVLEQITDEAPVFLQVAKKNP